MRVMTGQTRLSDRLRRLLEERNLRQGDFAELVGVSRQAVSGWINGSVTPSPENRRQMAEVLEVSVDYLSESGGVDVEAERRRYTTDLEWYLRPAPADGARTGGQAAEFAFEHSLRSLAPETAQNANDEKLDTEATVSLDYTVIDLDGDHLELFLKALKFDELRPHYEAIVDQRPDLPISGSIRQGLKEIDEGRLRLLCISDAGTTGLVGPEAGGGNFAAVMRDTLSSTKEGDKGGSYGLGKATMWAASRLGLVLAHSDLSQPEDGRTAHRIIGRLELPSRNVDGENWDGPGWYGIDGEYGVDSLWENETAAEDLQMARTMGRTGATFLIVGAHDGAADADTAEDMAALIEEELLDRFWPAMVPDANGITRLEVSVGVEHNGAAQSRRTIDPIAKRPTRSSMLYKYFAGEHVDELADDGDVVVATAELVVPKSSEAANPHPRTDHEVVVVVTQLDERTAEAVDVIEFMRGSRMIVEQRKASGLAIGHRPFRALVLVGSAAGAESTNHAELAERFLRRAEPPEHNRWTHKTRRVGATYTGAYTSLRNFWSSVNAAIADAVNRPVHTQDNGPDCLRELLRITDTDKPPRAKEPKVTTVSLDSIGAGGSWILKAKITVPTPRLNRQWRLQPVARFGVESGSATRVKLAEVEAVDRCQVDADGYVVVNQTARTAVVRMTTDPSSHPTKTRYSSAGVDVRNAQEIKTS